MGDLFIVALLVVLIFLALQTRRLLQRLQSSRRVVVTLIRIKDHRVTLELQPSVKDTSFDDPNRLTISETLREVYDKTGE